MTVAVARAADDGTGSVSRTGSDGSATADRRVAPPGGGLPILSKQTPASRMSAEPLRRMSVAELRQARALLKADQRRARMEHNAWIGHEPLRPSWGAIPMYRSRYERRTVYMPMYWYHR